MNLAKINEIRAAAGLAPLPGNPKKQAQHKRQAANRAARAQASRDLKSLRASGKKGK
jgi:hypothetical protein